MSSLILKDMMLTNLLLALRSLMKAMVYYHIATIHIRKKMTALPECKFSFMYPESIVQIAIQKNIVPISPNQNILLETLTELFTMAERDLKYQKEAAQRRATFPEANIIAALKMMFYGVFSAVWVIVQ